jgi:hypothetical protein
MIISQRRKKEAKCSINYVGSSEKIRIGRGWGAFHKLKSICLASIMRFNLKKKIDCHSHLVGNKYNHIKCFTKSGR